MSLYQNMPGGPSIVIGAVDQSDRLWQSGQNSAVLLPGFNICPGFGKLIAGTLLAKNQSASGRGGMLGCYVPYCPSDYTNIQTDNRIMRGRTFLTADGAVGANTVNVKLDESYRYVVGDDLIIGDGITPPENLGAITGIDRTGQVTAEITFTTVIGGTAFTVANNANIHVKCGASTPWMEAFSILAGTMTTGIGEIAGDQMPVTAIVPGNVVLNMSEIRNADAQALTDLGARIINNVYLVF